MCRINQRFVGKRQQAMDDALRANRDSVVHQDSVVKHDSVHVDSARKTSDIISTYRERVREKVVVQHDTVLLAINGNTDGRDSVYVNSDIAQLIRADDSTITALKNLVVSQDTLIAALRKSVDLRDTRIKLLESDRNPGKLRRILAATKYIAIGAVLGVALSHR